MPAVGWVVLALVFVDEVLAAIAAGVAGHAAWGVASAVAAPALVVATWWTFASPKAPLGGPVARPLVKLLVFGSASIGLWLVGHPGWAVALLVFSGVANGLAQLRFVRDLVPTA